MTHEACRVVPLTLLSRKGCGLCLDMQLTLAELVSADLYELHITDIDAHPELLDAYHTEVPVLFCGDTEVCRHFLDLEAVQQVINRYNMA